MIISSISFVVGDPISVFIVRLEKISIHERGTVIIAQLAVAFLKN